MSERFRSLTGFFWFDALQDLGIFVPFHPVKVGISILKSVISGSQRGFVTGDMKLILNINICTYFSSIETTLSSFLH